MFFLLCTLSWSKSRNLENKVISNKQKPQLLPYLMLCTRYAVKVTQKLLRLGHFFFLYQI